MRKTTNKRELGSFYEKIAGEYLESLGYQILEYNYRCKMGEIDIIAMDKGCLVFCEVKYRKTNAKGYAVEAVDYRKQRTISKVALYYTTVHRKNNMPCRFDVIGLTGDITSRDISIQYYKNAFDYVG